jgi:hypothetical protein
MTDSGLATFRIEKERWARFQQLAKDSNSNASKLIISFIDACLDNRIDIDDYTITQPKSAISTSSIDEYLDNNLDTRIGNYLAKNLNSYLDNRIDELPIKELIRASVETALDPIRDTVSKLQAVASHAVEIPAAIAKATTKTSKTKANGGTYPEWVKDDWKPFYKKLVGNSELIAEVAKILSVPMNNLELSTSLFELGIHKDDGEPYPTGRVGKIRPFMKEFTKAHSLDASIFNPINLTDD